MADALCNAQVVELSAQNVVMDSFLDTQSRTNSLQWFTHVYAYLAQYGQRVSRYAALVGNFVTRNSVDGLLPCNRLGGGLG